MIADKIDEQDETVKVALSGPVNAMLGTAATGTGTITDDDDPPTLRFEHQALRVDEDVLHTSFCMILSQPSGYGGISVEVSTSDGTATAGTDYTAISSQQNSYTAVRGHQ